MVRGFYAKIGRIAIKIPKVLHESQRSLASRTEENVFVSNAGIFYRREMSRNDSPDLSQEDIKSKSKANGIAKTLVCI